MCSLSSRPRGNDDDLRLLLHRDRRLLLHDEYLFRAEAAALAAKGKQGDDTDDADEATDDDTGDGAIVRLTATFRRVRNAYCRVVLGDEIGVICSVVLDEVGDQRV